MARSRWRDQKKKFFWLLRLVFTFGPAFWVHLKNGPNFLVISLICLGVFLLIFPRTCAATNRNGTICRQGSNGLLGGCQQRHHKMQAAVRLLPVKWRPPNLRPDLIVTRTRSQYSTGTAKGSPTPANSGLWENPVAIVTTLGAFGSIASVLVALLAWQLPVH